MGDFRYEFQNIPLASTERDVAEAIGVDYNEVLRHREWKASLAPDARAEVDKLADFYGRSDL